MIVVKRQQRGAICSDMECLLRYFINQIINYYEIFNFTPTGAGLDFIYMLNLGNRFWANKFRRGTGWRRSIRIMSPCVLTVRQIGCLFTMGVLLKATCTTTIPP